MGCQDYFLLHFYSLSGIQKPEFTAVAHPQWEGAVVQPLGPSFFVKLSLYAKVRPLPHLPTTVIRKMEQKNTDFPVVGMLTQNSKSRACVCHMQSPVGAMFKGKKVRHVVGKHYLAENRDHSHESATGIRKGFFPDDLPRSVLPGQFRGQVHIRAYMVVLG